MIYYAIGLLVVAAVGGLVLVSLHIRTQKAPLALALVHGLVAAAGLVIVLVEALGPHATGQLRVALGILVVGALGGFLLFSYRLRKKEIPVGLMAVHALVAVTGFAVLVLTVVK